MTVLKKTALTLAIATASMGVHADLKTLDDSVMSEMTGQAGLTIDLETKYKIGEFMYKDAGSIFLKGISFGGNTSADEINHRTNNGANPDHGFFDNVRVKLDIAGDGSDVSSGYADNYLETGFSGVRKVMALQAAATAQSPNAPNDEAKFLLASLGQITASDAHGIGLVADNVTNTGPMSIAGKKTYGDGDLLIHVSYKDAWEKIGGIDTLLASGELTEVSFEALLVDGLTKGKDFNFSIDAIGLGSSDFEAGDSLNDTGLNSYATTGLDADDSTTVLISDLSINGYLGPVDIHIENNGNGFKQYAGADIGFIDGIGKADSVINWDSYFNITDLDVYLDSWDGFAGMRVQDMKINNVRGDVTDLDGNFAFGFAHSKRDIYAVRNAAGYKSQDLVDQMAVIMSTADAAAFVSGDYQAQGVAIKRIADNYAADGIAINTVFKGDKEIGHLSFGDTGESIGELYWTDIESSTNWTISAH